MVLQSVFSKNEHEQRNSDEYCMWGKHDKPSMMEHPIIREIVRSRNKQSQPNKFARRTTPAVCVSRCSSRRRRRECSGPFGTRAMQEFLFVQAWRWKPHTGTRWQPNDCKTRGKAARRQK